jgi:site-specific DNA recombinase
MKHFYAYIRVSTVKQGERGSSLQEQRSAIETYARRHDLSITEWFEEKETAAKRGRRVFTRMLKALERGKAAGVIMHKIDRSARNLRDWSDLGELIDRGIAVHFAHESIDLLTPAGRLSADIQAVVAANYVRNLKDEVRKGFYGRLKQGLYPLRAPIGYLDRGGGMRKELDPIKAPLVRAAFELYAMGTMSIEELQQETYRRGLTMRSGKPISLSGLSGMLKNPFYMGIIEIKTTGQVFQGVHQPLISKELFDRVQMALDGRYAHRTTSHTFLFQRMLFCQHCGYRLIAERQKGHTYYRCHTKECPTTGLREEMIENGIKMLLERLPVDEQELEGLKELAIRQRSAWAAQRDEQKASLELSLANAEERLTRLTDALLDGVIDKELFETRKRTLLLERKGLKDRLEKLSADNSSPSDKLMAFLELAKKAPQSYRSGNLFEKRDLVKSVTSNLTVDQKNLVVKLRPGFAALATREKIAGCGPCRGDPRTHEELMKGGPLRDEPRTAMRKLFDQLVAHFRAETGNDAVEFD